MKKPIYIVSDNHFMLTKSNDETIRREKIFNLFNHINNTKGTLIIGGDFFDFWLESFYGVPAYYEDLLSELKKLNSNGIEIHYVVGNHDYWDFGFLTKNCGIIIHKSDFIFNINNKNFLITHGDGLLKNDFLYRFMKKIIRSKLFVLLVRLIPSSIMATIAKKISNTNSKFDQSEHLPQNCKKELEDYAINAIENNNINTVLMGHYHQLGIKEINDGHFIHLGDWITQFTVTIFNEEGLWEQKSWD